MKANKLIIAGAVLSAFTACVTVDQRSPERLKEDRAEAIANAKNALEAVRYFTPEYAIRNSSKETFLQARKEGARMACRYLDTVASELEREAVAPAQISSDVDTLAGLNMVNSCGTSVAERIALLPQ